jgi:hypothetical protein
MNGRIYDPLLGRFLSADILVEDATNLQAYNRYSYVRNNPLTLTDSTGFWTDQGVQDEMASTDDGRDLAARIGALEDKGWKVYSTEVLRDNGTANPNIRGYTDKVNKIIYIRRDDDEADYHAMKTIGHEAVGHAEELEHTGLTFTTLGEEIRARLFGDQLMIKTGHGDAVNPKELDKDGKPSADAIKAQFFASPATVKAYNMVPKNVPPPKPHVITADKTAPILVPTPKPADSKATDPKPAPPAPAPTPAPTPPPNHT